MTVAAPPSRPRAERLYPTLTPAQLARVAAHGRRRQVAQGEVLQSAGAPATRCFVVVAGRIDGVRPSAAEEIVVSLGPGMFTGEATLLSGRPGLAQIQAAADGEVIEVSRDDLLALIQTDGELSAIFMRAFILRRVELIARGVSDVVVLGSTHCQGTLRVREFLTRNGHPRTSWSSGRRIARGRSASASFSRETGIPTPCSTWTAILASKSCSIASTSPPRISP